MLSRLVMSQVKHNSYFLGGLALGLCVALVAVPLEEGGECGALTAAAGGADEFAAEHAVRPDGGGGGAARSVQRPRYYTTELGMRAPLLAAVLSSEEALAEGGRGAALNATMARLQPALRFFISASAPGVAPRANVVAFTDTREMLKPFHALKYLADNHLDEYDFFFLVSDGSFVNARRLAALAGALSVSQHVYMGAVAADDSHYCTLEGGILLSNSVLRAVHGSLDWCVRNSYSAHHHENVGRCVLHAAQRACAPDLQAQRYLSLQDTEDGAVPAALAEAVTVRGGGATAERLHALHAAAARLRLRAAAAARRAAGGALRRAARRAPPHYRNASWPRGLRDDAGLAPPPPDNRWDHLRWTAFNATHIFMPDDHRAVAPLDERAVDAKAVQLVVEAAKAWAARAWGAQDVELVEGAWLWEPARALRYQLTLRVAGAGAGAGAGALRRVEAARALGAARLVPVPYVTESARVWLALGARADRPAEALAALRRYEAACLARRANTALVLVVLWAGGEEPGRRQLADALRALQARHAGAALELAEARAGAAEGEDGGVAVLDAALRHTPRDALLLLIAPDVDYSEDFLNRVRMNCIPGAQWFLPAAFSRFAVWAPPRAVPRPATGTGRFNPAHGDVLAVYRQDFEAARARGPGGGSAAALLAASALRCVLAPEPGLVRAPRGPPCAAPPAGPPGPPACLRAERERHFARLDLGSRHSLAKLLLETQAEQS